MSDWRATYEAYVRSPDWFRLRRRVLNRASQRCERCGNRYGLQVHHLTYERLGHEALDDLLVLCPDCHDYTHQTFPKRELRLPENTELLERAQGLEAERLERERLRPAQIARAPQLYKWLRNRKKRN